MICYIAQKENREMACNGKNNSGLLPSDVIDFALLPTVDFWRETGSLLDVMWPRSNQWGRTLLEEKFSYITMNQRWNDIWNVSYMNWGYEIKWSYNPRSYERNFCNCVEKPEKFRTSSGFEPVTSRYRCDALTNWAMKPLAICGF